MLLTVPIVPLQPGDPARVAAGAPFIAARSGQSSELVPASLTEALDPATGQAFGAAQPFMARYSDAASALRAETCLTEAIYYEGALEPEAGQRAIAQVVLNRVRHPAYPDTVCGVVFQGQERSTGCQFTFTCDGARARAPVPNLWRRANLIARAALGGAVVPEVGLSTHYHADYVNPYWSASLEPEGQIGRHLFYRWRGGAGQAPAFSMRYSGREPLIAAWSARPAGPSPAQIQTTGVFAVVAPAIDAAPTVTRVGARGLLLQSRTDAASGGASATEGATQPTAAPAPFRARPLPLAEKAEGPA
jgi:spore germination cell wall hydrolase CwlJ-like protein